MYGSWKCLDGDFLRSEAEALERDPVSFVDSVTSSFEDAGDAKEYVQRIACAGDELYRGELKKKLRREVYRECRETVKKALRFASLIFG